MAKKKSEVPTMGSVNKIMGIIGGVILVSFIVVMFLLNNELDLTPKAKLPEGFKDVKKLVVEMDVKNRGKIQLELRNDLMPATVKNFVQKIVDKGYDNRKFYRVDNYMLISGSPVDKEGIDYSKGMKLELNAELKAEQYTLCMAKSQETNLSSKSIFFIMKAKDEDYFGKYSIFGKVANVESENVVDSVQLDDVIASARIVSLDGVPYIDPTSK